MALHPASFAETHRDLLRVLLIFAVAAAIFVGIAMLGAFFGVHDAAPAYPFLPDPAGLQLPF